MKNLILYSILLSALTCSIFAHADTGGGNGLEPRSSVQSINQKQVEVKGVVYDEQEMPVAGATVVVKGSTRGCLTDVDGQFSIAVSPGNELLINFLGYQQSNVKITTQKNYTVQLKPQVDELDEVTVVAFAKQKKESVISSVTTIKPAELKVPSSNLTTALAGRMAGMIAYQTSGEPGKDNAQFFIRGVTTFGYKTDPLILIDNVELSTDDLARLNVDDIASFSIMKDATSNMCHSETSEGWPQWFTFDLGVVTNLKEYRYWQRLQESNLYERGGGNLKKWELYGRSDTPAADGGWNGWIKLMECESIKPSKVFDGTLTTEDIEYAKARELFTFPINLPPVRYIRWKELETFSGIHQIHFQQITFWGEVLR